MTTKTLVASLAAVAASSVLVAQGATEPTWSEKLINAIGFENFTVGTTPSQLLGDDGKDATDENPSYFLYESTSGSDDASTVTNEAPYTGTTRPGAFAGLGNANYLSLSTEGGTLFRSLNTLKTDGGALALGDPKAIPDAGLYVDTLVQFTPCEEAPALDNANKLAVWLNVTETEGVFETNLCVRAGYFEGTSVTKLAGGKTYTLANTNDIKIAAGEWVRLTVKAIKNVYSATYEMPAFQVYINDTLAVFAEDVGDADALAAIEDREAAAYNALVTKTILPSMQNAAALQAVGFQGTGAIDDFVVTTDKPSFLAVDFTLFWDANITALEVYLDFEKQSATGKPVAETLTITNLYNVFPSLVAGQTLDVMTPEVGNTSLKPNCEFDWEKTKTVLTNVTMTALDDAGDGTGNIYGYRFTLTGDGPYSVTLVTKVVGVTPGSAGVEVEAADEYAAIAKVPLSITDELAAAAGQEKVVKKVATKISDDKWNVTVVINEQAEDFVDPDVAVAEVAGALSGTGTRVSIAKEKLTPGLYYSLGKATAVDGTYEEVEERKLADGKEGLSFDLGERGTAGFFKVFVNMTAE